MVGIELALCESIQSNFTEAELGILNLKFNSSMCFQRIKRFLINLISVLRLASNDNNSATAKFRSLLTRPTRRFRALGSFLGTVCCINPISRLLFLDDKGMHSSNDNDNDIKGVIVPNHTN